MSLTKIQEEELQAAALPLMEFLAKNLHPHYALYLDSERFELLEAIACGGRERQATVHYVVVSG